MRRRAAVKGTAYELSSIGIFAQGYRICISDMLSVFVANGRMGVISHASVMCQNRHRKEYRKSCENKRTFAGRALA